MQEDSWLEPDHFSFSVCPSGGVQTWQHSSEEQGMSKASLCIRVHRALKSVLQVSTVCCVQELLSGLNKGAELSLSTDISMQELTPTACLCAWADWGKVFLPRFQAGILTALWNSLSLVSSCAPWKQFKHRAAVWCGFFLTRNYFCQTPWQRENNPMPRQLANKHCFWIGRNWWVFLPTARKLWQSGMHYPILPNPAELGLVFFR